MGRVRTFNEKGIERFRHYLEALRENPKIPPPWEALENDALSTTIGTAEVDRREFVDRLDAAKYLRGILAGPDHVATDQEIGLWSWLSLFYFDQVCPADESGIRKPGSDYRHILDRSFRRRYRHLLAAPYHAYQLHGENARLLLCTPVYQGNDFHDEFAARQSMITNPGIIQAATLLYFDAGKQKQKRGARSTKNPGTLRRFVDVIQQLDLTYDLYGMNAEQLLALLPKEFDRWKGEPVLPLRKDAIESSRSS